MRNDTLRDALGNICGVQLHSGDVCEAKPAEDMPFPICTRHAIQLALAMQDVTLKKMMQPQSDNEKRQRREAEHGSIVYYVELPGDRIKIGTTRNLPQRLKSLRVGHAKVLATEPGGVTVERQRHGRFAPFRIDQREDFRDVPVLREWIAEVKQKQQ